MNQLLNLHKRTGEKDSGSQLYFSQVTKRVNERNRQRKNNRNKLISERRHLTTMSPLNTPQATKLISQNKGAKFSRVDMLAKWKQDKEKLKLLQKAKLKPVFKVTQVPAPIGLPNLETINREIKGKLFKKNEFASVNHKPPANLTEAPTTPTRIGKEGKIVVLECNKMLTRSQTQSTREGNVGKNSLVSQPKTFKKLDVKKVKTSTLSSTTPQKTSNKVISKKQTSTLLNDVKELVTSKTTVEVSDFKSSARSPLKQLAIDSHYFTRSSKGAKTCSSPNRVISSQSMDLSVNKNNNSNVKEASTPSRKKVNNLRTPDKTLSAPIYVSPFVTVSRGKSNARKEFHYRKSGGDSSESKDFSPKYNIEKYSSPTAGAAYFTYKLDNETARLQKLCDQWTSYKESENPPEEAIDMIDVAIGQSNLLTTKKFMQFSGLIEECRNRNADRPVTCEDLHGFWDMIYMQVVNLEKRFANLDNLMSNNWKEIIPEPKKTIETKKPKKKIKKVKGTSSLRDAIQAARLKKQNEEQRTPKQSRKSIFDAVKSSEKKKRDSSPGLMMMKVAQIAKKFEAGTPGKGILKTELTKSAAKIPKAVLFKDDNFIADLENDLNSSNTRSSSKVKVATPRRSSRLNNIG